MRNLSLKIYLTSLIALAFLGFASSGGAVTFNFAEEGNLHEAGYDIFDSDDHTTGSPAPHNLIGLPGGLSITASNGFGLMGTPTGLTAPSANLPYFAYMDGNWNEDAGLGVCRSNTNSCGSDDNQMQGEYIHMAFDYAVDTLTLAITGDHVAVVDNAMFWYSLNQGINWLSFDFGTANPLVRMLLINANGSSTFDYTIQDSPTQEAQMYLSAMTVSAVPVPAAVWLLVRY